MSSARPNVVFITCDQLRRDALGLYGNEIVQTPNINRLFEVGTRFTNLFAVNPVCAPNRGVMATGRWPKVNGLVANGYVLPESETTMMSIFRDHGYETYGVGKMHFTPQWQHEMDPGGAGVIVAQPQPHEMPHYGFDHVLITEDNRVGPYAEYLEAHGFDAWEDFHSFSPGKQHLAYTCPYPEEHHQTTWITDRAIEYLQERDRNKPFFMWVSYVDPHHPFNPPEPYDSMYQPEAMPLPAYRKGEHEKRHEGFRAYFRGLNQPPHLSVDFSTIPDGDWQRIKASYYGMVSLIDKNVGRLREALGRLGHLENTIFVFASDHGELLGDHHLLFKDYPFDCVSAMPFLIRRPKDTAPRTADLLCRSLDIMPTMLEVAGLPVPEHVNGSSLAGALDDDPGELFDSVLIEKLHTKSVRTKEHLLTLHDAYGKGELYDVRRDPDNLENLWDSPDHRDTKDVMLNKLASRIEEVFDPRFRKVARC